MATTEIHAIRTTPELAIKYAMEDKLIPYVEGMHIWDDCPSEIVEIPNEVGVPQKYLRYFTLNSFFQCNTRNPMNTVNFLQQKYKRNSNRGGVKAKGGEPVLWHAHQSFDGREIDPVTANKIGLEIAQTVFAGFPVVVSTHTNGANVHNHFMVCAYGLDGGKWKNDLAAYRRLRKESDRLCREHNLSVLTATENQRLIRFTDAEGKLHYFEPTDRKMRLMEQREAGEISKDDVNSFRNTERYNSMQQQELTQREIVKRDIDLLLPVCRSYEDLLERLRSMGYRIRDKKQNGQWLAHVSFQPPGYEKSIREDKIGDGEFYLRKNLSAILESDERQEFEFEPMHGAALPIFETYEYGVTELAQIDDDWRKTTNEFGVEIVVPRTEQERMVIADIRQTDTAVRGLIDATALRDVITQQNRQRQQHKPYLSKREEQRLVAQIMSSFQCLRFTEKNRIYGYEPIIAMYYQNKLLYEESRSQLEKNRETVFRLQVAAEAPGRAAELEARITAGAEDLVYQLEYMAADRAELARCRELMKKYGIETPHGAAEFREKILEFTERTQNLEKAIEAAAEQMAELENCMRTYERIDRKNGRMNEAAWKAVEDLLRKPKPNGEQDDESKKKPRKNKEER